MKGLEGFSRWLSTNMKSDGTLSRITLHQGLESVDMYLYTGDWRLQRKIIFSVLHKII